MAKKFLALDLSFRCGTQSEINILYILYTFQIDTDINIKMKNKQEIHQIISDEQLRLSMRVLHSSKCLWYYKITCIAMNRVIECGQC